MTTKSVPSSASRRRFLKTAALGATAAAATLASPNVSRAQTAVLRFQSTWAQRDIFHEFAGDYVKRVNDLGGGRLRLELLAAGAVVGAFQMQDAVHSGALDGGHGVPGYWYGKNKAFSLFGTAPPWFGDTNQMLGWYYYGGGEALYNDLINNQLRLNVTSFLTGPMPTQPLGWFKNEIKSGNDFRGMKYRTIGLAADLLNNMGAAVTIVPGPEAAPAIERGLLDGAEFNNPSSDRVLGLTDVAKVYMLRSYHQKSECFEVTYNKAKFDALPAEHKAVIKHAAEAASSDMLWKAQDRYPKDLAEMRTRQGVKTFITPVAVLDAQLAAWDKVIADLSVDAYFKRVCDSQRDWARRVTFFFLEYEAPTQRAYDHFFRRR
jgi:TRAP-type mannitol/chloroaromatic compound transport system substrate-binding protein